MQDKIFEILQKQIILILYGITPEQIQKDLQLKDLGANSIDRMEILLGTMEEAGINIPMSDLVKAQNIQGLIDIMAAQTA